MKKVLGTAVVLFFLSTMDPAFAQSGSIVSPATSTRQGHRKGCSLESLRGTYSFSGEGEVWRGANRAVEGDAGMLTFDGKGNFTGQGWFSLNGAAIRTGLVGTYAVHADCTAWALFTDDAGELIHQKGVVLGNGRETRFLETDQGVVISRLSRRIDH